MLQHRINIIVGRFEEEKTPFILAVVHFHVRFINLI